MIQRAHATQAHDGGAARFEAAGLRDKATADAYRRLILEPGGSRPTAELIEAFLGRPVNADAFKKKLLGDD